MAVRIWRQLGQGASNSWATATELADELVARTELL